VSVFPIHNPWKRLDRLIVEIVCEAGDRSQGDLMREVAIVRVNLRNGSSERIGAFPAFSWMHNYGRTNWPRLSADGESVVYLEPQELAPASQVALRVFSISTGHLNDVENTLPHPP